MVADTRKSPIRIEEVVIDPRFEGPTDITLGGYISGFMASYLDAPTVEVTMRASTPMGNPLQVIVETPERVVMRDGDTLLNEAKPSDLELEVPEPVTIEQAAQASERHRPNSFPNCYACGSGRTEDDGLHLRSGPVPGRDLSAIDWTPSPAAVGAPNGAPVPVPVLWAALECPIARAMGPAGLQKPGEMALLGRMTSRVLDRPRVGQRYFFMGWPIGREGRKIQVGGSLHDASGRLMAATHLLFITLRS